VSISRVYRLLRMITMLQGSRSLSAAQLSRELEVSRRTVFRDLNMLEMAHIPYYFDADKGGYSVNPNFFLPPVNLSLPEALAMLVLTGRLRGTAGMPLLGHASRAAVKLEAVLPPSIREHVGSVIDSLHASLGPLSRHEGVEPIFDDLASAIVGKRVCRIVYISLHERRQITLHVHPLRLLFHARAWYVLAHSEQHGELRTFKLLRIRKLTVTPRTFQAPPPETVQRHFGGAWSMIPEGRTYDVHVHFDRQVASNVAEVQWHATQRVQWNDDGSMEFFVRVDGLGEISWWILGYGPCAKVMAPAPLRQRVAESARAMAGLYQEEAAP
jgi:predicted DNA-binding transcriptional regulator YafY